MTGTRTPAWFDLHGAMQPADAPEPEFEAPLADEEPAPPRRLDR